MTLAEWARECFALDTFATQTTGIRIMNVVYNAIHNSAASVCDLQIDYTHRNARGMVMGGVFCTLADFATAIASNAVEAQPILKGEKEGDPNQLHWVTLESSINFLGQPKGDTLRAQTRCIKQGKTTSLHEVDIVEGNRLLAHGTATCIRVD